MIYQFYNFLDFLCCPSNSMKVEAVYRSVQTHFCKILPIFLVEYNFSNGVHFSQWELVHRFDRFVQLHKYLIKILGGINDHD